MELNLKSLSPIYASVVLTFTNPTTLPSVPQGPHRYPETIEAKFTGPVLLDRRLPIEITFAFPEDRPRTILENMVEFYPLDKSGRQIDRETFITAAYPLPVELNGTSPVMLPRISFEHEIRNRLQVGKTYHFLIVCQPFRLATSVPFKLDEPDDSTPPPSTRPTTPP